MKYEEATDKPGLSGTDKITGFTGVCDTVGFDVNGCVQVVLKPLIDKEGKIQNGKWFDIDQVNWSRKRIMPAPSFQHVTGPSDKPSMSSQPLK